MQKIIEYDLEKLKIEFKEGGFDIIDELSKKGKETEADSSTAFKEFCKEYIKEIENKLDSLDHKDASLTHSMVNLIYKYFHIKHLADMQIEKEMRQQHLEEMNFI